MTDAATKLMPALLALPPADRLAVAELLAESVPPEIDPAFEAELDRRRSAHEFGAVKGVPAADVFRRLREDRP